MESMQYYEKKIDQNLKLYKKNVEDLSLLSTHQDRFLAIFLNSNVCFEQITKIAQYYGEQDINFSFLTKTQKIFDISRIMLHNVYQWIQHYCLNRNIQEASKLKNNSTQRNYNEARCHYCKNSLHNMKIRSVREQVHGNNFSEFHNILSEKQYGHIFEENQEEQGLNFNDNFWEQALKHQYEQNQNSLYPKAESYITHVLQQERLKQNKHNDQFDHIEKSQYENSQIYKNHNFGQVSDQKINQLFEGFLANIKKCLGKQSIMQRIVKLCEILNCITKNCSNQTIDIETQTSEPPKQKKKPSKSPTYKIIPKSYQAKQREIELMYNDETIPNNMKSSLFGSLQTDKIGAHKREKSYGEDQSKPCDQYSISQNQSSESDTNHGKFRHIKNNQRKQEQMSVKKVGSTRKGNQRKKTKVNKREKIDNAHKKRNQGKSDTTEQKQFHKQYRQYGVQCIIVQQQIIKSKSSVPKHNKKTQLQKLKKDKQFLKIDNQKQNENKLRYSESIANIKNNRFSQNLDKVSSKKMNNLKIPKRQLAQISIEKIQLEDQNEEHQTQNQKTSLKQLKTNTLLEEVARKSHKLFSRKLQSQHHKSKTIINSGSEHSISLFQQRKSQHKISKLRKSFAENKEHSSNQFMKNIVTQNNECQSNSSIANIPLFDTNHQDKAHHLQNQLSRIQHLKTNKNFSQHLKRQNNRPNFQQKLFALKDFEIFGGMSEAFGFEKQLFSQKSQIFQFINQNYILEKEVSNQLQIVLNHLKNLSKFKSPIFECIVSFLCRPYSTVSNKFITYVDKSDLSCMFSKNKLQQNIPVLDLQLELIQRILKYLLKMHKKKCGNILCMHIMEFIKKIKL